MLRRALALAVILVAVVATIATGYIYLRPMFSANNTVLPSVTTIHIPGGSTNKPTTFNVSYFQEHFLTGKYPYLFSNVTVTVGVNNSILWINDDTEGPGHTVTALVAPAGASKFNSGLILSGKTFSVTLTVPGVYRYTCAWHNWLAGQINVMSA